MGLLEPGLLGQPQSGQAAFADALPNRSAKIILQHAEFHGPEYSTRYSLMLIEKVFHNPIGISTLTLKIHSYTIASSYNSILARWDRGHGRWIQRGEDIRGVPQKGARRRGNIGGNAAAAAGFAVHGPAHSGGSEWRVLKSGYEEGYFRQHGDASSVEDDNTRNM